MTSLACKKQVIIGKDGKRKEKRMGRVTNGNRADFTPCDDDHERAEREKKKRKKQTTTTKRPLLFESLSLCSWLKAKLNNNVKKRYTAKAKINK